MKKIVLGIMLSLGLSVSAYAGPQERGLLTGAVVGATAGAAIGSQSNETAQGAIIGAMFGAIAGAVLSSDQEQRLVQRREPRAGVYGHQRYRGQYIDDDAYTHARVHHVYQQRAYLRHQRAARRAHIRHEQREAYARHEYLEEQRRVAPHARQYGRVGGMVRGLFSNGQYYARAD